MSEKVELGTVKTDVPARLDRLPWARFHWMVVVGLGSVWILDGLEVTMVGNVAARMTEEGSGIDMTAGQIGTAGAIYVLGACVGAIVFGQLTDRFGRRKLFLITLVLYLVATVATAFSFSAWYFFLVRFLTGAGIGGEYAAVNSAIDELIPARMRGRIDLIINGSYWLGAAGGAATTLLFLNTDILPKMIGWRLAFAVGMLLAIFVFVVRKNVPESPRWLFIHGRNDEAERIVGEIEDGIEAETSQTLPSPKKTITVRQRKTISFIEIMKVAFTIYPKRAILCLVLFVGQAFLYNGITFNLGTIFSGFYGVAAASVPIFIILWSLSNFAGPVVLGRLFDTIGRKPMISFSYLGSAVVAVVLAFVFNGEVGGEWLFLLILVVCFFLASSGASAAYLTVSEIFPMETRALAIAFFYAVGTAAGGIAGPMLFGGMIESGDRSQVAWAFCIGAAVMALGGVAELLFGVKAEGADLEDIARPLTAEDAERAESAAESGSERTERSDRAGSAAAAESSAGPEAGSRRERLRLGPGSAGVYAPWPSVSSRDVPPEVSANEVTGIIDYVRDMEPVGEVELYRAIGARRWGPGRFRAAVREAVRQGAVHRNRRGRLEYRGDRS
ncbi:MFS transporter [Brevibacterium linens]|uniref:Predicted arabinose efflux permease, MFS family n=1 Tax=Brevibacterium linens ATCC 9172 TaxID=1255617 RepID=A0A2H1KBM7_BRELN|nr:MFS transporter [Brevibacterium linens]AZU01639.1 MFS transporter [Brevibacterium linens]KAB1946134.1 MFS transporter [Brevibacterium linens ATCC 9172]SMX96622.1 Predicted arabinose efflux permease, MFS family [Brevibacterium linens ATCC 9172]